MTHRQTPKTAKEIAAKHLVGVKITLTLKWEPVTVIKAQVIDDMYCFTTESGHYWVADIRHLLVVCRGGCKTLFNPRSEYSPDLCDKCWMEVHNP